MNEKSKLISGLKDPKIIQRTKGYFTEEEKHQIIQDYLTSNLTKRDIWEKHTGQLEEHGTIKRWMRKLGYDDSLPVRRSNFVSKTQIMSESSNKPSESFENLQLKKRIEELEKQLKDAEMKAISFSAMIDIAEKEFNIPIRKKSNTKPSKK